MGADKLWSEESQGGPLQLHSCDCPDFMVCKVIMQVLGNTIVMWVSHVCCSPSERGEMFCPLLISLWAIHAVCGTNLVTGVMPGCNLSWYLSTHTALNHSKRHPRSHITASLQLFLLKLSAPSDLASLGQGLAFIWHLPSDFSICPLLSSPVGAEMYRGTKPAKPHYMHGDISPWACHVQHPKLIDVLEWLSVSLFLVYKVIMLLVCLTGLQRDKLINCLRVK